jgi:predicted nuclease with RNAse H fold
VTERLCEVVLRAGLRSGPLPTMRIGQIAARGVALARQLRGMAADITAPAPPTVIEVYPYATLSRLREVDPELSPRRRDESMSEFAGRVIEGLAARIDGVGEKRQQLEDEHVRDSAIAAYTGWLGPSRLEASPSGFNVAAGWIWLPKAAQ